jgi:hypothetical protein
MISWNSTITLQIARESRVPAPTPVASSPLPRLHDVSGAREAPRRFAPGLRIIGFGRRVTIAFHVAGDRITIDRILYGGRDLTRAFRNASEQ